jgi:lambda repressor-like predicted transcriptional regulator
VGQTQEKVTDLRAARIRQELRDRGLSLTWLAEQVGYSRPHLSAALTGGQPLTAELHSRILAALGVPALVPETYKGRVVRVPRSIYAGFDPALTGEDYEAAWKASWLREHGEATLAIAAERAWVQATGPRDPGSTAGRGDAA